MKTHTSQLQLRNLPGYHVHHVEDMEDEHIASTNAGEESLGDASNDAFGSVSHIEIHRQYSYGSTFSNF